MVPDYICQPIVVNQIICYCQLLGEEGDYCMLDKYGLIEAGNNLSIEPIKPNYL